MILVTGGAGFIGSNFVLDWLASERRAGGQPGRLDLCRQSGEPCLALMVCPATFSCAVTSAIGALVRQPAGDAPAARDRAFRRRESRRPKHPRPGSIHADQRQWDVHAAGGRPEPLRALDDCVERAAFRFLHVSTDEVYGSLGPEDPPFTETHPYEPNSPYSASKAASDHLVRAWHHTYGLPVLTTNCSNNYGPYHFPEKLIPLMIVNALAGKAAAGLRRRPAGARLALRQGSLQRHPGSARRAAESARPTTSAAGTRSPTSRSCTDVCRAAR